MRELEISDADRAAARERYPSRQRVRVAGPGIEASAPEGYTIHPANLAVGFVVWERG